MLTVQPTEGLRPDPTPAILSEAQLRDIANAGSPLERQLALQLLHETWGIRTIRKLLVVYDPQSVDRAWRLTYELTGEST